MTYLNKQEVQFLFIHLFYHIRHLYGQSSIKWKYFLGSFPGKKKKHCSGPGRLTRPSSSNGVFPSASGIQQSVSLLGKTSGRSVCNEQKLHLQFHIHCMEGKCHPVFVRSSRSQCLFPDLSSHQLSEGLHHYPSDSHSSNVATLAVVS